MKTKICSKCKKRKPIIQFLYYKNRDKYKYASSHCKACKNICNREYRKRYPWASHWVAACYRCNLPKHIYFKKGIKCNLTKEETKILWFKYKAYLLKRPSIDRIDSKGDYTFDNVRFIEWLDNCGQGGKKRLGKKCSLSTRKKMSIAHTNYLKRIRRLNQ